MYTVRLLLNTTKYDEYELARRFRACWHVQAMVVKHAQHLLNRLRNDREYRTLRKEYGSLKKASENKDKKICGPAKARRKILSEEMKAIRVSIGLTESALQQYAARQSLQYGKMLASSQIQKIASNVWKSVVKILFDKGKHLHIKKLKDVDVIPGKNPKNGVCYYDADHTKYYKKSVIPIHPDGEIEYLGLQIPVKHSRGKRSREYMAMAMKNEISYCEIKRIPFKNKDRYYVILYMKGTAPKMLTPGHDDMGIDPGVSSMACVTDNGAILEELAPHAKDYERNIARLQRSVDRSLRISNPENYNPDGTRKKGRRKITPSKTCKRKMRMIRVLHRKQADATNTSHGELANKIIRKSGAATVNAEKNKYAAMGKRAKETTREDKASVVTNKKGEQKTVHKFKRKKRLGSSLHSRAPAKFLTKLENKVKQYGGTFQYVDTKELKASQYRHDTDTYEKIPLSQRSKVINGKEVQRDLYSAYIIRNVQETLQTPDRERMTQQFDNFVQIQNKLITEMKADHKTMKQVFGF